MAAADDQSEPNFWRLVFPADPSGVGEEPDYRFTLANERTFLAWIRTALALSAGGLASIALLAGEFRGAEALGIALLALSVVTAASAYRRWARTETAMRLRQPLPPSRLPMMMTIATAVVALGATIFFIIDDL